MAPVFSGQRGNTKTSTESTTYELVSDDNFTEEKEEAEKPMESTNIMHKDMPSSWWSTPRTMSKKRKSRRKKKRKTHSCSTASMRKHHHATFAHLIHDALIRLRCSPIYHNGFSRRAIARNIERHYRLKLGKKFKLRLQMSLTKLVRKGKLIPHGKKRSGIKYRASQTFLKQFDRLKVIDGAANCHFGVQIGGHCCERGRSRSSSCGRKSRSQSPSGSHNHNKSQSHCRRRKMGTKSQLRSRSHQRWKHWKAKHRANRSNKSRSRSRSQSRERDVAIANSEKASGGRGLVGWLWPSKEEKSQDKVFDKELASQKLGNVEQQEFLESYNNKRKHEDGGGERRYRKFKRIRIRERSSDESLSPKHYPSPKKSCEASEVDPYYYPRSEVDSQSSHDSLGYMESESRNSENDNREGIYSPANGEMENIDEEDADAMRETSKSKSNASWNSKKTTRQLKEHNMLHSMKSSSSHSSSKSRRTFIERISDTLRGAFGTQPTSSTTEQAGPSGSQNPWKIGQKPSKSCLKDKPMSRKQGNTLGIDGLTPYGEGPPSQRDRLPQFLSMSPKLARLLQE